MNESKRLYQAVVWSLDLNKPGERTTVVANDLDDAVRLLKEKYGQDVLFSLHSEEDADKPR
jgi:hypothetical protein